ncbi:MAG: hypothetical protein FJ312_07025 [SAR202 cluster bacterium]|nr:hypothetical protein [SAR202 cluster bacterium]
MTRPIWVVEGETTTVFIDLDGLRSLVVTGENKFALKPVVRVLAEEPEERKEKERERAEDQRPDIEREEVKERKVTGRKMKVEVVGRIEAMAADGLTVKGMRFVLGSDAEIEGDFAVGLRVKIEASIQSEGSLSVTEIRSKEPKERRND